MFSLSLSELLFTASLTLLLFLFLRKSILKKKGVESSVEGRTYECDLVKCSDCGEYLKSLSDHTCKTP